MKRRFAFFALLACADLAWAGLALISLAAPVFVPLSALAQNENGSKNVPMEPEARAEELERRGQCPLAVPIFRALVDQGTGYELSQFNLGRCLLDMAKTEPDAAQAASMRQEAAQWIIKAANSDLPNAQNEAVTLYLDGTGVASDPVEAGKWSLIYHSNNARRIYAMKDIDPDLQTRLDSALNDKSWAQARSRALSWVPVSQGRYR